MEWIELSIDTHQKWSKMQYGTKMVNIEYPSNYIILHGCGIKNI